VILGFQERFMSLSVNGSNTNNPAALWQSLLSPDSSASGTSQSDPLSELLAALGQNTGASSSGTSSNSASSSTGSAATTSGSSSPQFGPQTLQALFDLQANGSTSQSLASQLGGDGTTDETDPSSAQQSQPGEGQHAHHHHHHAGGAQSAADMFASAESATSQTNANSNGSSTTTITYADGSSVTLTTAPPSNSSNSSASSTSSSGSANVTGNNLLEQLIQMQAQLLTPAASQSSVTV
jgi:hypothetical protein